MCALFHGPRFFFFVTFLHFSVARFRYFYTGSSQLVLKEHTLFYRYERESERDLPPFAGRIQIYRSIYLLQWMSALVFYC